MSKILFQTVLLTKGDSLAKKLYFFCKSKGIGFFDTDSLAELFVNAKCLQPRIIFFDLDSIMVSEFICNEFLNFSKTKAMTIFLVSSDLEILNQFSNNYMKSTVANLEEVLISSMPTFLQQDFFDAVKTNTQSKENGEQVCDVLRKLGLSEKHLGFSYIKESVLLILANKSNLKSLSKTVFPTIAVKYQTNTANIERSIRTAIKDFDPSRCACFYNVKLDANEKYSAKKFVSFIVHLLD